MSQSFVIIMYSCPFHLQCLLGSQPRNKYSFHHEQIISISLDKEQKAPMLKTCRFPFQFPGFYKLNTQIERFDDRIYLHINENVPFCLSRSGFLHSYPILIWNYHKSKMYLIHLTYPNHNVPRQHHVTATHLRCSIAYGSIPTSLVQRLFGFQNWQYSFC